MAMLQNLLIQEMNSKTEAVPTYNPTRPPRSLTLCAAPRAALQTSHHPPGWGPPEGLLPSLFLFVYSTGPCTRGEEAN